MNKRTRKVKVRPVGSNTGLYRGFLVNEHSNSPARRPTKAIRIFVGPSVEGIDDEYVEIVSGKVSDRKPSFVR